MPTPWASACVPQSSLIQAVYVLFIWEDCTPSSKHLGDMHPIIQTSGRPAPHHPNIWEACTPSSKNIWGACTPLFEHFWSLYPIPNI